LRKQFVNWTSRGACWKEIQSRYKAKLSPWKVN